MKILTRNVEGKRQEVKFGSSAATKTRKEEKRSGAGAKRCSRLH